MSAGGGLTPDLREKIMGDCLRDPLAFAHTFLFEKFSLPAPPVHRGLFAILTNRSEFLLRYGEISWLRRNFVHETEEFERQIFHVISKVDGHELDQEEVLELDNRIMELRSDKDKADPIYQEPPLSFEEVSSLGVEVKLDLGAFTLLMMPRGISKTTIAGLAVPLYQICFRLIKFCLYVSDTGTLSQGQLENVRKELTTNDIILEFFGDLQPQKTDVERWSGEKFETRTGVAMQYRGKGAAIRGVNHNNKRPDLIIVDDPQERADIRSDTVREEDKRWAFGSLMPARERIGKSSIVFLGTYLGPECLVDVLSRDPQWTTVKMEVKDRDGGWLWPEYMNEEVYAKERDSFDRAGLLDQFFREYHNKDLDETQVPFPKRFIIYDPLPPRDKMVCATFADLATSEKRTADYSAICTAGITEDGLVWLLEAHVERIGVEREEDKIDEYFRQSQEWNSQLHGFESNAYQAVFGTLLRAEMFRRGHYFEVQPVTHKTRKVDRIRGALRPRYAAGFVRHRMRFSLMEDQLHGFRYDDSHMHDDGPDCFAACLVLLDPAAAYFASEDPAADQYTEEEDWIPDEAYGWSA